MTELDLRKLAAGRLHAANRQPFLAEVLFAMAPVAMPGLGSFAVDEKWRLLIDPARLEGWTIPEVGAVLLHEAAHLVRDHAERARAIPVGERDRRRWNLAADAEINDDLVRDGVELPGKAVLPSSLGLEPGKAAEYYFTALGDTTDPGDLPDAPDCGAGCHAGPGDEHPGHCHDRGADPSGPAAQPSDGDETEGSDGSPGGGTPGGEAADSTAAGREASGNEASGGDGPVGLRPFEQDLLRRKVAQEVLRNGGGRAGSRPGGWERWASALLDPRLDWRDLLRSALRAGAATMSGADDYTYRRPSRRRIPGVVLPSTTSPVPAVAVVVDTSASIGPDQLGRAWAEVRACLQLMGTNRSSVTVLATDTEVSPVLGAGVDVRVVGGGGTDLRKGFAAAMELRPRPGLLVVLTDGHTPWPDVAPPCRTVVALLGQRVATPTWATTIVVDPAE